MKIYCLLFFLLLITSSIYSQIERHSSSGISIGVGSGADSPFGAGGANYYYNLAPFKKRIELIAGIGICNGAVYRAGSNYRLYDNSKRFEIYFSFNYSYQPAAKARYDEDDTNTGYYHVSSLQYLHYFISSRYYMDPFGALQMGLGYAQNISGYTFEHTGGVDLYYDRLNRSLKNGVMFSLELIVFPFGKK